MNGDGDVDLGDVASFVGCLSGPNGGVGGGCDPADLDNGADVDLADGAGFQNAFTGS